jgi:hypothetical protein
MALIERQAVAGKLESCYPMELFVKSKHLKSHANRMISFFFQLLESEAEKTNFNNYERRILYKREVPMVGTEQQQAPLVAAQQ